MSNNQRYQNRTDLENHSDEDRFDLLLNSLGQRIFLTTDSLKVKEYIVGDLHPKSHIPELEIREVNESFVPANGYIVRYLTKQKNSKVYFDFDGRQVLLSGPITEKIHATELTFLFVLLFEHLYQSVDKYGMHAGAIVGNDGKSVVITADSLGGKTLSSIYICQNHNCKMIGDERIVLDVENNVIHTLGGNQIVSPRISSLPLIIPKYEENTTNGANGANVVKFDPSQLGIERSYGSKEVKAVCRIHISNNLKSSKEMDDFNKQLLIYTNLSTDIRATGYSFIALGYPLPSLDSDKMSQRRLQFTSKFQSIPCYEIFGDLGFITQRMKKIIGD